MKNNGWTWEPCETCGGSGEKNQYIGKTDLVSHVDVCRKCKGTGHADYITIDASTENGRVIAAMFLDELNVSDYNEAGHDFAGYLYDDNVIFYDEDNVIKIPTATFFAKLRPVKGGPVFGLVGDGLCTGYTYEWDGAIGKHLNVIAANAIDIGLSPAELDELYQAASEGWAG